MTSRLTPICPPLLRRLSALALLLLLPACASPTQKAPLRVGILPDNPPFSYRSPDSPADAPDWSGIEPQFARLLAADLGTTATFVPIDSPTNLLPALRAGNVDILMAGLTIRNDWRSIVEFSPPYLLSGLALLHRANLPRLAADPTALSTSARLREMPMTLAIPATFAEATAFATDHLPLATHVPVPNLTAALGALVGAQVDAVLAPAPVLWTAARTLPPADAAQLAFAPYLLAPTELAWACRPGATAIRDAMRAAVPRWTSDGTLARVLFFYLPASPR